MQQDVVTVGVDLAKNVFQVHGADASGAVLFRKKLRRHQVLTFFAAQRPCTVAMEACGSSHYWARSRTPIGMRAACCSGDLTGTKRMVGRLMASHSASASAASFLPRLT